MKKVLNAILEHGFLILSGIIMLLGDITFIIIGHYDEGLAIVLYLPIILFFFCINILSWIYAILFFRKENFLTPLLPLGLMLLGEKRISIIASFYSHWHNETNLGLITVLVCLFIRITAIVLIRIFKQKLQNWTGEERVTSDVVFWIKVLSKKLMKSINPKSNI